MFLVFSTDSSSECSEVSEKSPCSLPEAAMNDLEMLYPVNGTDCFSEIAQNYQINESKLKVIRSMISSCYCLVAHTQR